jgi:predicted nucleic acid-binding Zn ribbon protein
MPIYEFKCDKCGKFTEILISFSDFNAYEPGVNVDTVIAGMCSNKKCKAFLHKQNQVINFSGAINMNASQMGINQRSYNNKKGGPVAIAGPLTLGRTGL